MFQPCYREPDTVPAIAGDEGLGRLLALSLAFGYHDLAFETVPWARGCGGSTLGTPPS